MECPVCLHEYADAGDQVPFVLVRCGHSICSSCLNSIRSANTSRSQTCPECRAVISDAIRNYSVLQASSLLKEERQTNREGNSQTLLESRLQWELETVRVFGSLIPESMKNSSRGEKAERYITMISSLLHDHGESPSSACLMLELFEQYVDFSKSFFDNSTLQGVLHDAILMNIHTNVVSKALASETSNKETVLRSVTILRDLVGLSAEASTSIATASFSAELFAFASKYLDDLRIQVVMSELLSSVMAKVDEAALDVLKPGMVAWMMSALNAHVQEQGMFSFVANCLDRITKSLNYTTISSSLAIDEHVRLLNLEPAGHFSVLQFTRLCVCMTIAYKHPQLKICEHTIDVILRGSDMDQQGQGSPCSRMALTALLALLEKRSDKADLVLNDRVFNFLFSAVLRPEDRVKARRCFLAVISSYKHSPRRYYKFIGKEKHNRILAAFPDDSEVQALGHEALHTSTTLMFAVPSFIKDIFGRKAAPVM